jgi:hypothetical protein
MQVEFVLNSNSRTYRRRASLDLSCAEHDFCVKSVCAHFEFGAFTHYSCLQTFLDPYKSVATSSRVVSEEFSLQISSFHATGGSKPFLFKILSIKSIVQSLCPKNINVLVPVKHF